MTDTQEPVSELRVENALLRRTLSLTLKALKGYHHAPHFEIDDDEDRLEVIVDAATREKAAEAVDRAEKLLTEPERAR